MTVLISRSDFDIYVLFIVMILVCLRTATASGALVGTCKKLASASLHQPSPVLSHVAKGIPIVASEEFGGEQLR